MNSQQSMGNTYGGSFFTGGMGGYMDPYGGLQTMGGLENTFGGMNMGGMQYGNGGFGGFGSGGGGGGGKSKGGRTGGGDARDDVSVSIASQDDTTRWVIDLLLLPSLLFFTY